MSKIFVALATVLLSAQSWAALDPAPFAKHYELVRDAQGAVKTISLKNADTSFSIQPIIDDIRKDLEFAQMANLAMAPNFEIAMNEAAGPDWQEDWTPEQKQAAKKSYEALMKLDIPAVFENPKFKQVLKKFEAKLKEHLVGHRVMANLQDPKYFYSRAVAHQLANMGFNLAKKYLNSVPLLNIAVSIINEAISNVQDRRRFHQNMILFYFERFEPAQLGMTKDEVNFAKSSIYESKIAWFLYPESKKAQANWKYYGSDYHGYFELQADNTLEANAKRYSEIGERLCWSFVVVTEKGKKKIVNLVDRRFIFAPMPADAFLFDSPKKIERQRRLLRLTQLGLQFVPMPPMLKSVFNTFINSMYQNQEKTEGALVGYFEASGQGAYVPTVLDQTLNPYLKGDFNHVSEPNVWLNFL